MNRKRKEQWCSQLSRMKKKKKKQKEKISEVLPFICSTLILSACVPLCFPLCVLSESIVNRWDSIIDSMRGTMRPFRPWIHLYGLVKRVACTDAMEKICIGRITESDDDDDDDDDEEEDGDEDEEGLVVLTSRATELLRIRRARNSVSQQHIGTNRRRGVTFILSFFLASHSLVFVLFFLLLLHSHIHTFVSNNQSLLEHKENNK